MRRGFLPLVATASFQCSINSCLCANAHSTFLIACNIAAPEPRIAMFLTESPQKMLVIKTLQYPSFPIDEPARAKLGKSLKQFL